MCWGPSRSGKLCAVGPCVSSLVEVMIGCPYTRLCLSLWEPIYGAHSFMLEGAQFALRHCPCNLSTSVVGTFTPLHVCHHHYYEHSNFISLNSSQVYFPNVITTIIIFIRKLAWFCLPIYHCRNRICWRRLQLSMNGYINSPKRIERSH